MESARIGTPQLLKSTCLRPGRGVGRSGPSLARASQKNEALAPKRGGLGGLSGLAGVGEDKSDIRGRGGQAIRITLLGWLDPVLRCDLS